MNSNDWKKYWIKKAPSFKTRKERNIEAVKLVGENKKVLDVGCGHGELLELLQKNNDVVGIDFNKIMLSSCFKKDLNVKFGEAENLPFKDNTFDVVCALGLIEYLQTDDIFLKEIQRVLKSDGFAIISYRNELFSKWSKREFVPERRTHNPITLKYKEFDIEKIVFLNEHIPHKFKEKHFYHSAFLVKIKR